VPALGHTRTEHDPEGSAAMTIVIETPPKGLRRVVDASVADLIDQGVLSRIASHNVTASSPIPVFHLGANAIAEGRGLRAAERIGWISTLYRGRIVLGTLEFSRVKSAVGDFESRAQFASFATGGINRALSMSIGRVSRESRATELRLSIVRAPALYLLALWLRGTSEENSIVPVPPAPADLIPNRRYPADELLRILVEPAIAAVRAEPTRS
jgi:hypothetical protein